MTITYFQAILTGFVQGITELFPVSSLGHAVLLPAWIGGSWSKFTSNAESPYLPFTVFLHFASALAGVRLSGREIYVATVGGMKMNEPSADLAVALSVASAAKGLALPSDLVAIGEVGLAGEIRKVNGALQRIQEAARLGFKRALVPIGSDLRIPGIEIMEVGRLEQAISRVRIG